MVRQAERCVIRALSFVADKDDHTHEFADVGTLTISCETHGDQEYEYHLVPDSGGMFEPAAENASIPAYIDGRGHVDGGSLELHVEDDGSTYVTVGGAA